MRRCCYVSSFFAASLTILTTSVSVVSVAHAEDTVPTRVQLVRLAEAELEAGRPAEAANTATRVMGDPPRQSEGATEIAAWERARAVFTAANVRVAHLTVGVTGGVGVTVDVDGSAMTRTSDLLVDPGEHVIVARSEGYESAATTVRVRAGESRGVALTLIRKTVPSSSVETMEMPALPPRSLAMTIATTPPDADESGTSMHPARIAAFATLGTGLAALTVGAITGIVSQNKISSLRDSCPNNTCPPSQLEQIDSAKKWGNVSTVAFVTSAALLGTSGILFLTGPAATPTTATPKKSVSFGLGPGAAVVSGSF